ncbi:DumPY: shorter than wild-type [Ditylenchus destructor]|nr:DumPY: shorter than wild-type [Ditylenchus destructor]
MPSDSKIVSTRWYYFYNSTNDSDNCQIPLASSSPPTSTIGTSTTEELRNEITTRIIEQLSTTILPYNSTSSGVTSPIPQPSTTISLAEETNPSSPSTVTVPTEKIVSNVSASEQLSIKTTSSPDTQLTNITTEHSPTNISLQPLSSQGPSTQNTTANAFETAQLTSESPTKMQKSTSLNAWEFQEDSSNTTSKEDTTSSTLSTATTKLNQQTEQQLTSVSTSTLTQSDIDSTSVTPKFDTTSETSSTSHSNLKSTTEYSKITASLTELSPSTNQVIQQTSSEFDRASTYKPTELPTTVHISDVKDEISESPSASFTATSNQTHTSSTNSAEVTSAAATETTAGISTTVISTDVGTTSKVEEASTIANDAVTEKKITVPNHPESTAETSSSQPTTTSDQNVTSATDSTSVIPKFEASTEKSSTSHSNVKSTTVYEITASLTDLSPSTSNETHKSSTNSAAVTSAASTKTTVGVSDAGTTSKFEETSTIASDTPTTTSDQSATSAINPSMLNTSSTQIIPELSTHITENSTSIFSLPTGETASSTASPQIKAKLANLLNRLKQELYLYRQQQQESTLSTTTVNNARTTIAYPHTPAEIIRDKNNVTTPPSTTTTGEKTKSLAKIETMLESLKKRLEEFKAQEQRNGVEKEAEKKLEEFSELNVDEITHTIKLIDSKSLHPTTNGVDPPTARPAHEKFTSASVATKSDPTAELSAITSPNTTPSNTQSPQPNKENNGISTSDTSLAVTMKSTANTEPKSEITTTSTNENDVKASTIVLSSTTNSAENTISNMSSSGPIPNTTTPVSPIESTTTTFKIEPTTTVPRTDSQSTTSNSVNNTSSNTSPSSINHPLEVTDPAQTTVTTTIKSASTPPDTTTPSLASTNSATESRSTLKNTETGSSSTPFAVERSTTSTLSPSTSEEPAFAFVTETDEPQTTTTASITTVVSTIALPPEHTDDLPKISSTVTTKNRQTTTTTSIEPIKLFLPKSLPESTTSAADIAVTEPATTRQETVISTDITSQILSSTINPAIVSINTEEVLKTTADEGSEQNVVLRLPAPPKIHEAPSTSTVETTPVATTASEVETISTEAATQPASSIGIQPATQPIEIHSNPTLQTLNERLEEARRLREERRRLEMLQTIHAQSPEENRENEQRRHVIEQKLIQLAQTERWHRELLQRYHLQQRAFANANNEKNFNNDAPKAGAENLESVTPSSVTSQEPIVEHSSSKPKHCDPVQRFVDVFKVQDPAQWLRENCVFAKQYFPTASCSQIQALLSECFFDDLTSNTTQATNA